MRPYHATRLATTILAISALTAGLCNPARATQTVTLHVTLTPEQLGHGTTIGFGFNIDTPPDTVPPPLTSVEINYPTSLAIGLSELGLATCTTRILKLAGPQACPANSELGYGTARAEIRLGPSIADEAANVTIYRAANHAGHLALLIYVNAPTPISEQFILPGLLLPAPAPYGGRLTLDIPLIATLPGAPDAAVVQFHSTLGPMNLHYHEHIHGHVIEYEPKGIPLPDKCPHDGFHFSANFTFQNGNHSQATDTVPCPWQAWDKRALGEARSVAADSSRARARRQRQPPRRVPGHPTSQCPRR